MLYLIERYIKKEKVDHVINCCKKPIPCKIFYYSKICLSSIIYYYMYLLISENAFSMKVKVIFTEEKRFQMVDKEPEQIGQASMRI